MIELIVPALGLAVLLPKFLGAVDDLFFAGLFHCVLSWTIEHGPVRLRWGLWGAGPCSHAVARRGLVDQCGSLRHVPFFLLGGLNEKATC
jgi:hypothetical protein